MPKTHTEIAEDIRRHGEMEASLSQGYSVIDQINRPVSVMRSDGRTVADFSDMSSTREERVARARRFAASERMLAHLKWFVENDVECLGDHPLMLAKIRAIIAEVENI